MIDYLDSFSIPEKHLPQKLKQLFSPIALERPTSMIEVAARFVHDQHGPSREYYHYSMVIVPEDAPLIIDDYHCSTDGVSDHPAECDEKGGLTDNPHRTRHNHIVESWGNGSFFSYYLSNDVWIPMGLTPRCVGGDEQRVIFDDLSVPTVGVAEGDLACSHYWTPDKNIHWKMRNDYLRRYLWEKDRIGVRVFFYEGYVSDIEYYESLLSEDGFYTEKPEAGWYDLTIRKNDKGILLQIHAVVAAIKSEKCEQKDIYSLIWPGDTKPLTRERTKAVSTDNIYLSDSFLIKYEKNSVYDSTPSNAWGIFDCSPSYLGQWFFTECRRLGRNLIRVPVRELYKPKPDGEILHAFSHAIPEDEAKLLDFEQEHIVAKTFRFVDQLLSLDYNLLSLAVKVGAKHYSQGEYTGFSQAQIHWSGWKEYPILSKLAQVAPLDMSKQDFLSRCKTLSEILGKIKPGPLKKILMVGGCTQKELKNLKGLKLLQALMNIATELIDSYEDVSTFEECATAINWKQRNKTLAPLFITYDLRVADAHENVHGCIEALEAIGFDHANLRDGYGLCLDFVFDRVIEAIEGLNNRILNLLNA